MQAVKELLRLGADLEAEDDNGNDSLALAKSARQVCVMHTCAIT